MTTEESPHPPSQREKLLAAKLRGLSRNLTSEELVIRRAPGGTGGLVASQGFLVIDSGIAGADRLRATGDASSIRSLGPALIWARSVGASHVNVFVDHDAGDLARRAEYFGDLISIYEVDGVEATLAEPACRADPPSLSEEVLGWSDLIRRCGADPVDDYSRLVAEVRGLEVARVEIDEQGEIVMEVGVGEADRLLYSMVHYDLDSEGSLARAVEMVKEIRVPGPAGHPLQRLAKERWFRSALVADPTLVDGQLLEPAPPLRPRETLLGTQPAACVGTNASGDLMVVVCSVGIDPDLVPEAADYRDRFDPEAELVLVVPERDRLAQVTDIASLLPITRFASPTPPWEIET